MSKIVVPDMSQAILSKNQSKVLRYIIGFGKTAHLINVYIGQMLCTVRITAYLPIYLLLLFKTH
ncbi:hypothetical protein D3C75_1359560 [compost metagenome]